MNCDGIPNLLQQPQSGLPTMTVTQGELTVEEREDLEDQLIAVRDKLLEGDEDPELVDLVYRLLGWLYDADTPELADDARATIPHLHHLWCGTRHFDLLIDDSDEGEDYGTTALPSGILWCPCAGTGAGPHHAEEVLELVVPHPGARKIKPGG